MLDAALSIYFLVHFFGSSFFFSFSFFADHSPSPTSAQGPLLLTNASRGPLFSQICAHSVFAIGSPSAFVFSFSLLTAPFPHRYTGTPSCLQTLGGPRICMCCVTPLTNATRDAPVSSFVFFSIFFFFIHLPIPLSHARKPFSRPSDTLPLSSRLHHTSCCPHVDALTLRYSRKWATWVR